MYIYCNREALKQERKTLICLFSFPGKLSLRKHLLYVLSETCMHLVSQRIELKIGMELKRSQVCTWHLLMGPFSSVGFSERWQCFKDTRGWQVALLSQWLGQHLLLPSHATIFTLSTLISSVTSLNSTSFSTKVHTLSQNLYVFREPFKTKHAYVMKVITVFLFKAIQENLGKTTCLSFVSHLKLCLRFSLILILFSLKKISTRKI